MTERLRQAVALAVASVTHAGEQAERLEVDQQEEVAAHIEALANELRWQELLNDPDRVAAVDHLADEALAAFESGQTRPLAEVLAEAK